MAGSTNPQQLLTVTQVESMTGLNIRHFIFNDVDEFASRCVVRLGRSVRIRADRLEAWIDDRTGAQSFSYSSEWREKNAKAPLKRTRAAAAKNAAEMGR